MEKTSKEEFKNRDRFNSSMNYDEYYKFFDKPPSINKLRYYQILNFFILFSCIFDKNMKKLNILFFREFLFDIFLFKNLFDQHI